MNSTRSVKINPLRKRKRKNWSTKKLEMHQQPNCCEDKQNEFQSCKTCKWSKYLAFYFYFSMLFFSLPERFSLQILWCFFSKCFTFLSFLLNWFFSKQNKKNTLEILELAKHYFQISQMISWMEYPFSLHFVVSNLITNLTIISYL